MQINKFLYCSVKNVTLWISYKYFDKYINQHIAHPPPAYEKKPVLDKLHLPLAASDTFFTKILHLRSTMNIHTWNKSSRSKSVRLGQNYAQREYDSPSKWLVFWRIITKQKKKKKKNSDSTFYDPNTYMQNFDEGSGRVEPDNLYRSFSARYADPSRISCRMNSMK
ncbi:Hypothetical predicted protein [Olea europaea subsp. europaea]|uniref:Uncharacterized protein n=1 Tax=Olea europaea subsp. europaea TaxID=158383 RepID=A0A8S0S896_OLEEU|nr:Hypothetical predicted protein [Olea europaea subsp. europaea]